MDNRAGENVVGKSAATHSDADVVYVPILSCARPGGNGVVVVNGDDEEADARVKRPSVPRPGRFERGAAGTSSIAIRVTALAK